MDSPLITATWQAGALSALSNILGQAVKCYQTNKPFSINTTDFTHFALFAILATPPNFMWQAWLESKFPAYTESTPQHNKVTEKQAELKDANSKTNSTPEIKKSLNIRNTAIKFGLDQTAGATVNTLLFIAGIDLMRGRTFDTITADCRDRFWPMVFAGIKLWPAISLMNFTLVPVEYRVVVGSVVGLFWGIYLSMISSSGK